jgi:hypothetical protein
MAPSPPPALPAGRGRGGPGRRRPPLPPEGGGRRAGVRRAGGGKAPEILWEDAQNFLEWWDQAGETPRCTPTVLCGERR